MAENPKILLGVQRLPSNERLVSTPVSAQIGPKCDLERLRGIYDAYHQTGGWLFLERLVCELGCRSRQRTGHRASNNDGRLSELRVSAWTSQAKGNRAFEFIGAVRFS